MLVKVSPFCYAEGSRFMPRNAQVIIGPAGRHVSLAKREESFGRLRQGRWRRRWDCCCCSNGVPFCNNKNKNSNWEKANKTIYTHTHTKEASISGVLRAEYSVLSPFWNDFSPNENAYTYLLGAAVIMQNTLGGLRFGRCLRLRVDQRLDLWLGFKAGLGSAFLRVSR